MIGIVSYGGCVPRYRLNRMMVFMAMGWFNPVTMAAAGGEKAVANFDEDSITMAVSAAIDCLAAPAISRESIDGLYLASTTLPYSERLNAAIAASALDLNENCRTADFSSSLRASTSALLGAIDAIKSGANSNMLVAAADSRLGKMGSLQEMFFGDAGAALCVGSHDVIAEFKGSVSISADFPDHIRECGARFDRNWEERWMRDEGYSKLIPKALKKLAEKFSFDPQDVAKVIYPCHFGREHRAIGKRLGLERGQVQSMLMDEVGDSGSAHPLLMLIAALEQAKPGDKLVVVGYGNGADALLFQCTDAIADFKGPLGVSGCLQLKEDLNSYQKYTVFRNIVPMELGIRGETQAPTPLSVLWRERRQVMGLVGTKCQACGWAQYPSQRICVNPECGAIDQMEPYRFSDKPGTIFTYTGDMLAFSFDPPAVYGIVDFEGGGRTQMDFTDCLLEKIKVGQQVKMSFRRKYYDQQRGIHGYFWKAVPVAELG
ncbi:MAG: OB-fold domain-containing protein [Candidatus Alcyoniella australis]|nr:OB-fold domain-containing protein [Candidatus Alcyoniella australis]